MRAPSSTPASDASRVVANISIMIVSHVLSEMILPFEGIDAPMSSAELAWKARGMVVVLGQMAPIDIHAAEPTSTVLHGANISAMSGKIAMGVEPDDAWEMLSTLAARLPHRLGVGIIPNSGG